MKLKLTEQNKFILKFFILWFFWGVNFLAPYLVIMFSDYKLNAKQISFIFIVTEVIQLISEIPSGALADRFGRKKTLLLSNVIYMLSLIILLIGKNFNIFLTTSIFSGLALSLMSGTFTALMYDNMKKLGIENQFGKLRGKAWALRLIGMSTSAFGASYLVKFGYDPLIVSSLIANLGFFFMITLFEDSYGKHSENIKKLNKDYWKILTRSAKYTFKHITALKFLLFEAFLLSILKVLLPFRELFLFEITSKRELVGILISIQLIFEAISRWFLVGIFSDRKTAKVLSIVTFAVILMFFGFIFYSFPASYILMVISWSLYGSCGSTMWGKYQKFLPSRWRSTIISMNKFLENILGIISLFIFGILADAFTYRNGFIITATYQIIFAGMFLFWLGFDKHLRKKERGLR